jgi:hypothetical protein
MRATARMKQVRPRPPADPLLVAVPSDALVVVNTTQRRSENRLNAASPASADESSRRGVSKYSLTAALVYALCHELWYQRTGKTNSWTASEFAWQQRR